MQAVALEIADHLAIEVELVQMTAAVVQAVEPAAIGQLGLDQVAEFVVVMLQHSAGTVFLQQLAKGVVSEGQLFTVACLVGKTDCRQLIERIVAVQGFAVVGLLADQASDGIPA
ncbi:hypothetical protein D3C79_636530 [compost metagenome]